MTDMQASVQTGVDGPSDIGGWLILPILGLVATPLRGVVHLATYGEIFKSMQYLTSGQIAFVWLEIMGNVAVLLVLPVVLLALLYKKSAAFPSWFIIWAGVGLAFILLDLIAAQVLFGDVLAAAGQPLFDAETTGELFRSIILAAIWIPYMRVSRRVANTFVN